MAGETVITIVGNLTADPELRFVSSGIAICNFTVANNPRTFDRNTGEWRDSEGLFLRCNAWRSLGEHVAESLRRGMRVMVQGRLKQRTFETRDGEKRTIVELDVDEIGASLKYATATVTKATDNKAQQSKPASDPANDGPWEAAPELVGAGAGDSGDLPSF